MAILVQITLEERQPNQVLELLDSPEGNDFTASQQGCERREVCRPCNPNQILDELGIQGKLGCLLKCTKEITMVSTPTFELMKNGIEIKF